MKKIFIIFSLMFCQLVSADIVKSNIGAKNIAYVEDSGGGISAKDYVQDGLVALYDGIENIGWGKHDYNTLVWKDLIGNNDITYSASSLTSLRYWLDNGFYQFNSGTFYWQATPSYEMSTILKNGLQFTVEVVAMVNEIPSSSNSCLINIADGMQSSGLQLSYNGQHFMAACLDAWGGTTPIGVSDEVWGYMSMPFHCGVSMNGANENGYMFFKTLNGDIEVSSSSIIQNKLKIDLTKMIIGGYAWSSIASRNHRGVLYCIRIYNRALSTEELDYNHQIDEARFNLP